MSAQHIEDLKAFAGKACLDIYNDFDSSELDGYSESIKSAWKIGEQISKAIQQTVTGDI